MASSMNHIQKNAMELIVEEEITRQLRHFPPNLYRYINKVEVATYALNRLPALYASSVEGLERQKNKAQKEYRPQVKAAVRQALAAVQRDLLRACTPLTKDDDPELQDARNALEELAEVLPYKETSWSSVVKLIKPLLTNFSSDQNSTSIHSVSTDGGWADYRYHC